MSCPKIYAADLATPAADSTHGPRIRTSARQQETTAPPAEAHDVDVKQEDDEADVDRFNIDRLAQEIVREAARFEQTHSLGSRGQNEPESAPNPGRQQSSDSHPSRVDATVAEAATDLASNRAASLCFAG